MTDTSSTLTLQKTPVASNISETATAATTMSAVSHTEPAVTIAKPNSLSLAEINMPLFKFSNCLGGQECNGNISHSSFYHNDDHSLRERFESMNMNGDMKGSKFHSPITDESRDILTDTRHLLFNRTTPTTTPLSPLPQHQSFQIPQQPQRNYFSSMLQNDHMNDGQQQQQPQHHQKHLNQFTNLLPSPLQQQQFLPSPYDLSPQDLPFFLNHPNYRFNPSTTHISNNINNNNNFQQHIATSPKSDEVKSFLKSLRKNNNSNNIGTLLNNNNNNKKHDADFNNIFYNDAPLELNNNNTSTPNNNIYENFKLPNYIDTYDMASIASNSQLSEALILRLKQQNSLAKQQLNNNFFDLQLAGSSCRELLNRHFTLNNVPLVDQERLARLYLCELIKDNPNLMTNHFLNNSLLSGLTSCPIPGFANGGHIESFSRKVFVGGLPPDSDENDITASFRQFGPLIVDWPHKAETKTSFPPKGYCFLLFQDEMSVQKLMEACQEDDGKYYWCIPSTSTKDKPVRRVQIRPWSLIDSDFLMDASQPLDLRKTVFVGGVPRPLKAAELAIAMDQLYGNVCYAGIDTDPELKYPKGAGRVSFSTQQSYISAISARFVQLQFGDIDKRVEVKPYVLDDQLCDECQGQKSAGKSAPYYCANVACLQYYCENCWVQIHSRPGREFHKPLVKEGADRPKSIPPFKW